MVRRAAWNRYSRSGLPAERIGGVCVDQLYELERVLREGRWRVGPGRSVIGSGVRPSGQLPCRAGFFERSQLRYGKGEFESRVRARVVDVCVAGAGARSQHHVLPAGLVVVMRSHR